MSRVPWSQMRETACFPRVSGDEPVTTKVRTAAIKFSPRERG